MAETLIRLFEQTRQPGRCRGCEALIDWYDTLTAKRMPMNRGAVPRKSELDSERRVVAFFDAADSHWASCPGRSLFTKRPAR